MNASWTNTETVKHMSLSRRRSTTTIDQPETAVWHTILMLEVIRAAVLVVSASPTKD